MLQGLGNGSAAHVADDGMTDDGMADGGMADGGIVGENDFSKLLPGSKLTNFN